MARNFPKLMIDNKTKIQVVQRTQGKIIPKKQMTEKYLGISTLLKNEDEKILKVVRGKS